MSEAIRPRRNRKNGGVRAMVKETSLTPSDLVYPLFVHEGADNQVIESMPGCIRWSVQGLVEEASRAFEKGIPAVVLFPAISDKLKTACAKECYNDTGLIPFVIQELKKAIPALQVITDIALDPYSSDGHDGLVSLSKGWGIFFPLSTVGYYCR